MKYKNFNEGQKKRKKIGRVVLMFGSSTAAFCVTDLVLNSGVGREVSLTSVALVASSMGVVSLIPFRKEKNVRSTKRPDYTYIPNPHYSVLPGFGSRKRSKVAIVCLLARDGILDTLSYFGKDLLPKREQIKTKSQLVPVCMKFGAKAAFTLFVLGTTVQGLGTMINKVKDGKNPLPFKTTPKVESAKRFENAQPAIAGK
jgi:hypothetical protein